MTKPQPDDVRLYRTPADIDAARSRHELRADTLHPEYPQDRLAYMLADSAPVALITNCARTRCACAWVASPKSSAGRCCWR